MLTGDSAGAAFSENARLQRAQDVRGNTTLILAREARCAPPVASLPAERRIAMARSRWSGPLPAAAPFGRCITSHGSLRAPPTSPKAKGRNRRPSGHPRPTVRRLDARQTLEICLSTCTEPCSNITPVASPSANRLAAAHLSTLNRAASPLSASHRRKNRVLFLLGCLACVLQGLI